MQPVAGSGLRHLHALENCIAMQAHSQVGCGRERGQQGGRGNPKPVTANLHYQAKGTLVQTNSDSGAHRPFTSHHTCFNVPAASHGHHNRGQTTVEEVHKALLLVRLMKSSMTR